MIQEKLKKQLDLCMGCGYCRDAYGDEGWLDNLKTKHVCPVREILGFDAYTAKGRILLGNALYEKLLPYTSTSIDIFYKCTLCGNCEAHCISRGLPFVEPDLKVREIIKYFREKIVRESLGVPEQIEKLAIKVSQHGNVFGEESPISSTLYLKENYNSENIYFLGCMVRFRENQIAKAVDEVANKLSLNLGVLDKEFCCGNPLLRTGQVKAAKSIMAKNIEILNKLKIKTLITSCPGCFSAFKNEYPNYGFHLNFRVQHIAEFLLNSSKIGDFISNSKPLKVTYHDPCELGRINKIYAPPRQLLQSIPNLKLIEPFRTGINAWCCGAGAGVQAGYSDLSKQIAINRFNELQNTKANFLITACPNCVYALGKVGKIYDIIEFLNNYI
ncbi:MAG: (Fe-S)-binding protein [Candidatus Hermodarchaeota archaeon]